MEPESDSAAPGDDRVTRWEHRAEVPLLLLAFAFLGAYAWPVLDENLDRSARSLLEAISWAVWLAFVVDYAIRIYLADDRRAYALRHWYDVPLIALPMLRPLRVLRILSFARMVGRSASGGLVERVSVFVGGAACMSVALGALAELNAEQDAAGANITSFGDALWWACETVSTVGYGDRYPATAEGRAIAVVLMIVGVGLVGAVTAAVAAWMVAQVGTKTASR